MIVAYCHAFSLALSELFYCRLVHAIKNKFACVAIIRYAWPVCYLFSRLFAPFQITSNSTEIYYCLYE